MPSLTIEDPEAQAWAAELSKKTGKSLTQVVKDALHQQLEQDKIREENHKRLVERVMRITDRISSYPVLDNRTPDEIIGYDENGIPS